MEIKNFIKVYDNALPIEALSNFLRFINKINFEDAKLIGDVLDTTVRKTQVYAMNYHLDSSLTAVHWCNFIRKIFLNFLQKYKSDCNIIDFSVREVKDISILKYKDTGFYSYHVDHDACEPRTMSAILLLNNDYEGGNLSFRNPDGTEEMEVDVKANRLILWPSNFLFPHAVKPIKKGTRYSVVIWAL